MRTCSSISIAFSVDVRRRRLHVLQQHVLDLVADLADRIERRARVLEDHRHLAAAQVAHLVFAGASRTSMPVNMHRAVGDAAGAVENAHHGVGGDRLAGAGFADDADGLALGDA